MMKTNAVRREGTVVVAVAVSLIGLLSFLALSIDGGFVLEKRQNARAVADAAAMTAAGELYARWQTSPSGLDPDGSIAALAKKVASTGGYADGVNGVTVTVNIPPTSGQFVGSPFHAEVVIGAQQPRYFSTIMGSTARIPVRARAVGRGRSSVVTVGIMALDPKLKGSFQSGGNGAISVTGGANVLVNSTSSEGMIANGGGSISAPTFSLSGSPGWNATNNSTLSGTTLSNQPQQPDPLRYLPVPDPTTMPAQSASNGNKVSLKPGVYTSNLNFTGNTTVTMDPGVYYIKGASFSFSGASLTGSGVMIYMDPSSTSDNLSITGGSGSSIALSPPTSGPWQGISIFQRRDSENTVKITGGSGSSMAITGTFYAAGGTLQATGNGDSQTIGSQYISNIVTTGGNGSFSVNWDPNIAPRRRELFLVE
ncbi:hypothetical protein [Gemmata sp.]|uniref:hypothetical protein n=1 Tax=Gemmata sp. TaxID=1914242 RepID=UPI003F6F20DF